MSSSGQNLETEIKLRAASVEDARQRLEAAGFRVKRRRVFEQNFVLDTPEGSLRTTDQLLRLRRAGRLSTVTYKGPSVAGPHKSREELEFRVSSAECLEAVFERLGFRPQFRYEKYRTEFERTGEAGVATLDETPIGVFIELEGQPDWIDLRAAELGYSKAEYELSSYTRLNQEYWKRLGNPVKDMVFA